MAVTFMPKEPVLHTILWGGLYGKDWTWLRPREAQPQKATWQSESQPNAKPPCQALHLSTEKYDTIFSSCATAANSQKGRPCPFNRILLGVMQCNFWFNGVQDMALMVIPSPYAWQTVQQRERKTLPFVFLSCTNKANSPPPWSHPLSSLNETSIIHDVTKLSLLFFLPPSLPTSHPTPFEPLRSLRLAAVEPDGCGGLPPCIVSGGRAVASCYAVELAVGKMLTTSACRGSFGAKLMLKTNALLCVISGTAIPPWRAPERHVIWTNVCRQIEAGTEQRDCHSAFAARSDGSVELCRSEFVVCSFVAVDFCFRRHPTAFTSNVDVRDGRGHPAYLGYGLTGLESVDQI